MIEKIWDFYKKNPEFSNIEVNYVFKDSKCVMTITAHHMPTDYDLLPFIAEAEAENDLSICEARIEDFIEKSVSICRYCHTIRMFNKGFIPIYSNQS